MNKVSMSKKANDASPTVAGQDVPVRSLLNDNKAGMQGLDREKISRIIYEASKGSNFFKKQEEKEAQMQVKLKEQKQLVDSYTESQRKQATLKADDYLATLEPQRDLSSLIIHIDMDAFYAAVEMRDQPELKTKPMAVGGSSMLSTSNYLARRFGVRAGMPGFIAKKLCPDLILVPGNHRKYSIISHQVKKILAQYDPNFSSAGLDEAYLDFTKHVSDRLTTSNNERTFRKYLQGVICGCGFRATEEDWLENKNRKNDIVEEDRGNIDIDSSEFPTNSNNSSTGDLFSSDSELSQTPPTQPTPPPTPPKLLYSQSTPKILNTQDHELLCPECDTLLDWSEREFDASADGSTDDYVTFGIDVEEAVREMRFLICRKTLLTASAGIAPNTLIAKVSSDYNKPNGQFRVQSDRTSVMEFVEKLPIRKVHGIGKVSEQLLQGLNIENCYDLYKYRDILYLLYQDTSFQHYMRISKGIAATSLERDNERKSMSVERTFSEINKPLDLYNKCKELCENLSEDLIKDEIAGKVVTLKLKTVTFTVMTRAQTLRHYTNSVSQIYIVAAEILKKEINLCSPDSLRLRLMGVKMSNLLSVNDIPSARQKTLESFFQKADTSKQCNPSASLLTTIEEPSSSISTYTVVEEPSVSICPICGEKFPANNSRAMILHVEECLLDGETTNKGILLDGANDSTSGDVTDLHNVTADATHEDIIDTVSPSVPTTSSTTSSTIYICPVCSTAISDGTSLQQFNNHVDGCLTKNTIREIITEQRDSERKSLEQVDRGSVSRGNVSIKGNLQSTSSTTGTRNTGKRKTAMKQNTQRKKPKVNSIESFFK